MTLLAADRIQVDFAANVKEEDAAMREPDGSKAIPWIARIRSLPCIAFVLLSLFETALAGWLTARLSFQTL